MQCLAEAEPATSTPQILAIIYSIQLKSRVLFIKAINDLEIVEEASLRTFTASRRFSTANLSKRVKPCHQFTTLLAIYHTLQSNLMRPWFEYITFSLCRLSIIHSQRFSTNYTKLFPRLTIAIPCKIECLRFLLTIIINYQWLPTNSNKFNYDAIVATNHDSPCNVALFFYLL